MTEKEVKKALKNGSFTNNARLRKNDGIVVLSCADMKPIEDDVELFLSFANGNYYEVVRDDSGMITDLELTYGIAES